jgi:hypothetical protein
MPDDQDKHRQNIILDLVDDAIVADPYPVAWPPFEFFIAVRPGIVVRLLRSRKSSA